MSMLDKIREVLVNKWTMGASLCIVGAGTFITPPMSATLNKVWFSIPVINFDVTILRFMGVLTLALGVAVLTHRDPLGVSAQV
ncbi:hypothetical protein CMK18_21950 [Candidatus Poribacteria bacterium]|nr:hypothetical protein [Candidatus Poribacteria bacterium]